MTAVTMPTAITAHTITAEPTYLAHLLSKPRETIMPMTVAAPYDAGYADGITLLGRKGGNARAEKLSDPTRRKVASKAALARWHTGRRRGFRQS